MYLFTDTKNMPTHWNLGCIHGISYHPLFSADWWLVPLTRDEGGKDRPRQRLQLKSIIRKVPSAVVFIVALRFCLLSMR